MMSLIVNVYVETQMLILWDMFYQGIFFCFVQVYHLSKPMNVMHVMLKLHVMLNIYVKANLVIFMYVL